MEGMVSSMKKYILIFASLLLLLFVGCNQKTQRTEVTKTPSKVTPTLAPSPSPSKAAVITPESTATPRGQAQAVKNNIYNLRILKLINEKKYEEALKLTDRAIKFSSNPTFYRRRAEILRSLGKYEESKKALDKALSLHPSIIEKYLILSNYLIIAPSLKDEEKISEKAISEMNKIEKQVISVAQKQQLVAMDVAQAMYIKASACKERGKLKEALESFKKALEINPKLTTTTQIYLEIAETLFFLGEKEKAKEYARKWLDVKEMQPGSDHLNESIAVAYKILGEYDKAIESINKGEAHFTPEMYLTRAEIFYLKGDKEKARQDLMTILKTAPKDSDEYKEAQEHLKKWK